jgi:hypothetical protein
LLPKTDEDEFAFLVFELCKKQRKVLLTKTEEDFAFLVELVLNDE